MEENFAEFLGVFIGDGCMSKYKPKSRKYETEIILLTGDWEKDSVGLDEDNNCY